MQDARRWLEDLNRFYEVRKDWSRPTLRAFIVLSNPTISIGYTRSKLLCRSQNCVRADGRTRPPKAMDSTLSQLSCSSEGRVNKFPHRLRRHLSATNARKVPSLCNLAPCRVNAGQTILAPAWT